MRLFFIFAFFCALLAPSVAQSPTQSPLKLQTGRAGAAAALVGDSIYVFGGYGGASILGTAERIDLQKKTAVAVPSMQVPRMFATAQADGPYIFVCGGVAGPGATAVLTSVTERYDTRSSKTSVLAPLPTPRRLAASALVGGKMYVVGGSTDSAAQTETGVVDVYDIKTNTWTGGPPMPTPRECALAVKNGMIYALGGYDGHNPLATVEVLDTAAGKWSRLPDMPFVLSAHRAVVDGDFLFTFGDFLHPDRVSAYNFRTKQWKLLTGTDYAPSRHNVAFVWHGAAYVVGGDVATAGPFLDSVQTIPLPVLETAAR